MARACPFPTLEDSNANSRSLHQKAAAGTAGPERPDFATFQRKRSSCMLNRAGTTSTCFEKSCRPFPRVPAGWLDRGALSPANKNLP
jgi:hypothetical protein